MRNFIKPLTVLLAVAIGTAGCDEFSNLTDINQNPNAPTSLAPEFLLPSLIRGLANGLVGESNIDLPSASLFVQHFARIQYAGTDRYDLGTDYCTDCWDEFYNLDSSLDPSEGHFVLASHMLDGAVALGDANQTAVAMILRAYAAHNLTDMYGDVPYFQAAQGGAENSVIRPVYDAQSAIYDDLFVQLTAAVALINTGAPGFGGGDKIYSGDMEKWRRFGNSLRLRLAMRISDVNPSKAATEAAAAVAGGVMETPRTRRRCGTQRRSRTTTPCGKGSSSVRVTIARVSSSSMRCSPGKIRVYGSTQTCPPTAECIVACPTALATTAASTTTESVTSTSCRWSELGT